MASRAVGLSSFAFCLFRRNGSITRSGRLLSSFSRPETQSRNGLLTCRCIAQRCFRSDDAAENGQTLGKLAMDEGKLMMLFTCDVCDERSGRLFSKRAYQHGVVIVRCPGCKSLHLIADNLGWFGDKGQNIETILEAKGKKFHRSWDEGGLQLDPEDIELTETCLAEQSDDSRTTGQDDKPLP